MLALGIAIAVGALAFSIGFLCGVAWHAHWSIIDRRDP